MSDNERELIDLRLKILNAAANKVYLRNRDIEKLRNNYPEITEHDFGLLWKEMPGFKEALTGVMRDICEPYEDPNGRILLRLKTNGLDKDGNKKPKMEDGKIVRDKNGIVYLEPDAMDSSVKYKLEHFFKYKVKYAKGLKVSGRKLTDEQKTEAVSAAWNFLYVGDSVESWDYFRELKPTVIVSDKLRTMDHPMIKALGKWGVWKGSEKPGWIIDQGQEEPFVAGSLSAWVLDRLKYEPKFKDRLIDGDLKDLLPRTMVVSMIEATSIGKGTEKTNLADALLNGKMDLIAEHFKDGTDKNLMQPHNDMVQGGEFILNLIRGKIQYSAGKNDSQFVSDFVENTSLIRQEPNIPLKNGELGVIAFVDKPEFFKWSLMVALGFNPFEVDPLPQLASLGATENTYDIMMKGLVDKLTIRSLMTSGEKKRLYGLLHAKNLFDYRRASSKNTVESALRRRR